MAQYAVATKNKGMYDYVAALANAEGITLPKYAEEKAAK